MAMQATTFDLPRLARKVTTVLFLAQALGSGGFITMSAVNSIAGANLSGQAALAGVPSATYQFGAAFAALCWGYLMDRLGRRGVLVAGLTLGVLGAGIAGGAVIVRSFGLFLAGSLLMGVASGALQLGRFAAAEVHLPVERGRAIANVVMGGTAGAILGPLLVGPAGQLAQRAGQDELSGPYAAALALFVGAVVVIAAGLRPDPRDLARELARRHGQAMPVQGAARPVAAILAQPPVIVAIAAMVVGQVVMGMLMVITSLHMRGHNHSLAAVSFVISSHTFGMFAFSILSGRLTDRWGRVPVILLGIATLVLAALTAPLSPQVVPLAVALFLLGLGWNLCYVGGSSLLADQLAVAERARVQGLNDLFIGLASAFGSVSSGIIFAAVGYGAMGVISALAALVPLAPLLWWQAARRRLATS